MAMLGGLLGGGGDQSSGAKQFQRFTPEQQGALNQILQMGMGGAEQGAGDFGPIAEQARTQFKEQTIPTIAERFTAMGAQGSGAFRRSLGQAGAGLETNLAALQSQHGLQRQGQLQQLLGMGLQPQFDTFFGGQQPGALQTFGGPIAKGLGQGFGGGLGEGLKALIPILLKMITGG